MPTGGVPIPIFLRIHHLGIAPSPVPDCRPIEPQGWAVTFVPGVLFFDFRPQNDDFVMTLLVTRYLYPFMFFCFHFFHRFIYWLISQRIVLSTCVAVQQGDSLRVGGGKPGALAHRRAQAFFRRVGKRWFRAFRAHWNGRIFWFPTVN
jgi:hypothetical protein